MKTLALLLALTLPALAGTRDDTVPDSRYLDLGEQLRPYTAEIAGVNADQRRQTATAVIISPRWAITAAHVAAGCDDLVVTYGEGVVRSVDRVCVNPDWQPGEIGTADVALCHLERDAGLEWYPVLADTVTAGQVCLVAGYGITGRMSAGYDLYDGRLRAGTQRVDRVEGVVVWCKAQRRGSALEYCIAPGDSGGPLFVGSGKSARLAAINSFQSAATGPLRSRYGEETGHVSIPAVRGWIDEVMEVGNGRQDVAVQGQAR
jgi:hypothetical protein